MANSFKYFNIKNFWENIKRISNTNYDPWDKCDAERDMKRKKEKLKETINFELERRNIFNRI